MKIAIIVSLLVTSLALNAQTLQGKVVRVADGDTITVLDEAMVKKVVPKPITFEDFRKQKKGIVR